MEQDHYRVLGVDPSADLRTIREAFRRKVMVTHPDRGGTHEEMVLVNEAWYTLSDPERRRHYDFARTRPDDAAAQAAARVDAEAARKRAEDYPKTWAETEVWLGGLTRDFARAHYGALSFYGDWSIPTAGRSKTGWLFILLGAVIGGCLISPFLVKLFLDRSGIPDKDLVSKIRGIAIVAAAAAPVLCGAWAGAAIHLGIASALSARKSVPAGKRIVACACGQKLRIPFAAEELSVTCSACRGTFSCPPVTPSEPVSSPPPPNPVLASLGRCAGVLVALFVCGLAVDGCGKRPATSGTAIDPSSQPLPPANRPPAPVYAPGAAASPRISVSGTDATRVLIAMVSKLSEADKKELADEALRTARDMYAVRVRIANTGNVAVTVVPENLRLHYRGVSNLVSTIPRPGFLTRSVIGPGEAVEGIVMYRESIENGAKIRLQGGAVILYIDPNLQVEYP